MERGISKGNSTPVGRQKPAEQQGETILIKVMLIKGSRMRH